MLPVLFSACSDSDDSNDDGGDGTADSGLVKIAYTADRTSENIFGQMNFGVTFAKSGGDGSVSMADVRESYDSIVWKVEETGRSFKLMDNVRMTMQWSHCFYLPGSYTTYVVGYKGDREIFRTESVALKVTDNKDFLCWNWNDMTGNEGNTGYKTCSTVISSFPSIRGRTSECRVRSSLCGTTDMTTMCFMIHRLMPFMLISRSFAVLL